MSSFMEYYLPQFRDFIGKYLFPDSIFDRKIDFIVPIEMKGAMLINEIIDKYQMPIKDKVVYARMFDFIPPSELSDKTVLLIDDIAFTGKTLREYDNTLSERGVKYIIKAAFLKGPTQNNEGEQKKQGLLKDIMVFHDITYDQYHDFGSEMTELNLRKRPSYPDHLGFIIETTKPIDSKIVGKYGCLMKYDRSKIYNDWSLHYPIFKPNEINCKKYDGPFKIRFRRHVGNSLNLMLFPVVFPSLKEEPKPNELLPLEKNIYEVFAKSWHGDEVRKLNIYESVTLSDRIKYICLFMNVLETEGIQIKEITPILDTLDKYYGYQITREIGKITEQAISERRNMNYNISATEDTVEIYKIPSLMLPILSLLQEKYLKHPSNKGKPPEEMKSVGLTIDEIASELNENIYTTSASCEFLNDYGYLVPLIRDFSRKYRDSEIGKIVLEDFGLIS